MCVAPSLLRRSTGFVRCQNTYDKSASRSEHNEGAGGSTSYATGRRHRGSRCAVTWAGSTPEALALLDGRTASGRILRRLWHGGRELETLRVECRLSVQTATQVIEALRDSEILRVRRWSIYSSSSEDQLTMLEVREEARLAIMRAVELNDEQRSRQGRTFLARANADPEADRTFDVGIADSAKDIDLPTEARVWRDLYFRTRASEPDDVIGDIADLLYTLGADLPGGGPLQEASVGLDDAVASGEDDMGADRLWASLHWLLRRSTSWLANEEEPDTPILVLATVIEFVRSFGFIVPGLSPTDAPWYAPIGGRDLPSLQHVRLLVTADMFDGELVRTARDVAMGQVAVSALKREAHSRLSLYCCPEAVVRLLLVLRLCDALLH